MSVLTAQQAQELRDEVARDTETIARLLTHPVVDHGPIHRLQERIAHHEAQLGIDQE